MQLPVGTLGARRCPRAHWPTVVGRDQRTEIQRVGGARHVSTDQLTQEKGFVANAIVIVPKFRTECPYGAGDGRAWVEWSGLVAPCAFS